MINVVVITTDNWNTPGWSAPASRIDLLPRLPAARWAPQARALVREPETWLKWALYDRQPLPSFGYGAAALIGDAAHPMLPFLAQGAAMAIEDAVVAARCLAAHAGRRRRRAEVLFGNAAPAHPQSAAARGEQRCALSPWRGAGDAAQCGDAGDGRRAAVAALRLALRLAATRGLELSDAPNNASHPTAVPHDDRRQSAEARMACGAEQAVGAVAARRRRARHRQGRRHAVGDQAAGGCRHRYRRRRRAVAPAFRPRFSRSGRRHRLRPARRDGHPQRSLQGDVSDRHRPVAAARARACPRSPPRPRPHQAASSNSLCRGR